MGHRFEYGVTRIQALTVHAREHGGKRVIDRIDLDGRAVRPSSRFWHSLHVRFGFTSNIFRYFTHAEVFERISQVAPTDQIRWCLHCTDDSRAPTLLAVTNPAAAIIRHPELTSLLRENGTKTTTYADGIVTSHHQPRLNPVFQVAGDGFENRFVLDTPIDGYGRPAVYLSLLRLVCSNGLVGFSPTFRSELSVGKGEDGVGFALQRVLEGFNNEDGYAALRQRFESAARSWASVNEANRLYRVLARLHGRGEVRGKAAKPVKGGDGASETPILQRYHTLTGDLTRIYGLANLDALSAKRQRTLPSACKVYDLLNFASEVATHHADESGNRAMQAYIGELVSGEFDLEGTADQFTDWRDFFIGHDDTSETLAQMHRRSAN